MSVKNLRFLSSFTIIFVGIPLFGASAEPFHHKFGELREYHQHWLAVCPDKSNESSASDYKRTCWATTHAGKPGFFFNERLSVSRDRFNGEYKVRFVSGAYEKLERSKPVEVKFSDGSTMSFPFGSSVRNSLSINEFLLAADNPQPLISAMKKANWMQLSVPTTQGPTTLTYSMIGLTAALEFTKNYANHSN